MGKNKQYKNLKKREAMGDPQIDKKKGIILAIIIFLVAVVIIAGAIIFDSVRSKKKNEVITYSIGLNEEGKIKSVSDVGKYVELCDFDKMNKNVEDYYPDQETEDTYINSIVESFPDLITDTNKKAKTGDSVSIDFVTYIDDKEVDGGNTNGAGIMLTLGAAGYPENFEEQIAGHKAGETFDVNITFADDFGNEELAGKEVLYKVTLNGIYEVGEFNDEFIKKNFGDQISSADEFVSLYRASAAQNNFDSYVCKYIISDSTVTKTPTKYKKEVIKLLEDKDIKQMENTNSAYENLYGETVYKDVLDMRKMTEAEYKEYLDTQADSEVKTMLVYQALYEKYGLSITQDDLYEVAKSYSYEQEEYDQAVERFGEPYIRQQAMYKVVTAYLAENYDLEY